MDAHRYKELDRNPNGKLTKEEIKQGWHFCPDWDFMLIHRDWPEYHSCTCDNVRK